MNQDEARALAEHVDLINQQLTNLHPESKRKLREAARALESWPADPLSARLAAKGFTRPPEHMLEACPTASEIDEHSRAIERLEREAELGRAALAWFEACQQSPLGEHAEITYREVERVYKKIDRQLDAEDTDD